jgi:hypothetical protein
MVSEGALNVLLNRKSNRKSNRKIPLIGLNKNSKDESVTIQPTKEDVIPKPKSKKKGNAKSLEGLLVENASKTKMLIDMTPPMKSNLPPESPGQLTIVVSSLQSTSALGVTNQPMDIVRPVKTRSSSNLLRQNRTPVADFLLQDPSSDPKYSHISIKGPVVDQTSSSRNSLTSKNKSETSKSSMLSEDFFAQAETEICSKSNSYNVKSNSEFADKACRSISHENKESLSARTKLNIHRLNTGGSVSSFKPSSAITSPSECKNPSQTSDPRIRTSSVSSNTAHTREKSQNKPISAFAMPSKSISEKDEIVPYGKVKVSQICKLPERWDGQGILLNNNRI